MAKLSQSRGQSEESISFLRLAIALLTAPMIMAIVLTGAAFLIAGMSEPTQEDVLKVTTEAGIAMISLNYAFTLTFGLLGVVGLWFLDQRGPLVWAIAGGLMGALAGVFFGTLFMGGVDRALLLAFGLGGWALFILIRWIGGIRLQPSDRSA